MEAKSADTQTAPSQQADRPNWITVELVAETQKAWAARFSRSLSEEDAIGLILSMGQLFDATGFASSNTTEQT